MLGIFCLDAHSASRAHAGAVTAWPVRVSAPVFLPLAAYRMCANTLATARTACRATPPLISDMGGIGVRLSRLATGHRACAARSGLYCLAPLLHSRQQRGMGFVCQCSSTARKRRAGCLVLAVEPVGQGTQRSDTHPRAGVEGAPSGGGRATTRLLGPMAQSAWPTTGGRGPTPQTARKRLTRTLCGFGAADTALAK